MVAVDGRQSGYSVGVTTFELAQQLVRLGAVTGTALDSGGSTTMAFNGKLLNRPSDPGGERAISDSLDVFYYGVVVPQAPKPVLSPNGDGVAETQTLTYKLVRPATVTASLVGPDGIPRQTETGVHDPGTYRTSWSGRTPDGAAEPEGRWRWVVNALDDQGQHSKVERRFYLNRTLGFLRVRPTRVVVHRNGGKLRVGFRLAHPAVVTLTIRNARGGRVKTMRRRLGSGPADDPLERALRERRSRVHGRVRGERAGGQRVRAHAARAALSGAAEPGASPARLPPVLLASLSGSLTTLIGDHGLYAVFLLMLLDAVLPAASELVMLYAGVVASGALAGQHVVLFGHRIDSHFWALRRDVAWPESLGNTVGSVDRLGDRPLRRSAARSRRHGRWLHLGPGEPRPRGDAGSTAGATGRSSSAA